MYNRLLGESCLSTRMSLYENPERKSSMPFPLDTGSLAEELKCVYLQCYFWLKYLNKNYTHLTFSFMDESGEEIMIEWQCGLTARSLAHVV